MRYSFSLCAQQRIALLTTLAVAACNSYDASLLSSPSLGASRRECSEHTEACNNVDDDCDGIIDEDASATCSMENARTHCSGGTCVLDACNEGYLSCDGISENGCEHDVSICGGCDKICAAISTSSAGEPAPAPHSDAGRPRNVDDVDAGELDSDAGGCSEERCDGKDNDCDGRTDEGAMCGCTDMAPTGQGAECDRCACEQCSSALDQCLRSGNAEWDTNCGALARCVGKNTVEGRCTDDADCGSTCGSQWVTAGWRPNRSCSAADVSTACAAFVLIQETCYQTKCDKACKH